MRMKGVVFASLPLMLFFAGICETQLHATGSSDPGQTDPGYDYPPPPSLNAEANPPPTDTGGSVIINPNSPPILDDPNYGGGNVTFSPDIPEPSTASLLLFGLTAALAFRRRS